MHENRIKSLRKAEGFSQKELGMKLGVGQTTVSAWESGRNEPDYESLKKMAELLDCSIDYLMGYTPDDTFRGLDPEEQSEKWAKKHEQKELEKWYEEEVNSQKWQSEYDAKEYEDEKVIEDWEEVKTKVFKESIQIDHIFESLNLTTEERERAVKMINVLFEYKKEKK